MIRFELGGELETREKMIGIRKEGAGVGGEDGFALRQVKQCQVVFLSDLVCDMLRPVVRAA